MQNLWFVTWLRAIQLPAFILNTIPLTGLLTFFRGQLCESLYDAARIFSTFEFASVPPYALRSQTIGLSPPVSASIAPGQTPEAIYAAANLSSNFLYNAYPLLLLLLAFALLYSVLHALHRAK